MCRARSLFRGGGGSFKRLFLRPPPFGLQLNFLPHSQETSTVNKQFTLHPTSTPSRFVNNNKNNRYLHNPFQHMACNPAGSVFIKHPRVPCFESELKHDACKTPAVCHVEALESLVPGINSSYFWWKCTQGTSNPAGSGCRTHRRSALQILESCWAPFLFIYYYYF